MDQFNRNTYKKQGIAQDFANSCLGKIIITAAVMTVLAVIAIISEPSDEMTYAETEDNIRQCLQDNDSTKLDTIDETIANIGRTVTTADSTLDNKEMLNVCRKHNKIEVYRHTLYSTARIRNNAHPEGVRVGVGLFGFVISTVYYDDLVLDLAPVRGEYNERLIQDIAVPDEYIGENPNLKPYHYKGNPDD